jgi:ectoine hydroxylase-related dioxygenase (phytanoyl-CoA dioxygenase family)
MCVHQRIIPWYVSVWCALDDVTLSNGALQFVPLYLTVDQMQPLNDSHHLHASPPIEATAGSIIIFRSDVWHFSAVNASDAARRAFYVQYSVEPITSSSLSKEPLCCAIPIDVRNESIATKRHHESTSR